MYCLLTSGIGEENMGTIIPGVQGHVWGYMSYSLNSLTGVI